MDQDFQLKPKNPHSAFNEINLITQSRLTFKVEYALSE